jgi:phosphoserine phosphatase
LWKPRPHISTIEKVLLDYTITPNAENVVKTITQKGIHTAIITSGLDILANSVASRLGICNVAANGLVFDEDGFLTDKVTFRVDLLKKHKAFNELIEKLGIPRNQSVAVGDSRYDTNFLKNAGLGVAYTKDNELASAADITITDLKELLNFL